MTGSGKKTSGGASPDPQFHTESQFRFLVKTVLARKLNSLKSITEHIPGICDDITLYVKALFIILEQFK